MDERRYPTSTSPWFPDGQPEPLVLASASPRRRELLRQIGLRFVVDAGDADETPSPGRAMDDAAREIALRKARAIAPRHPGAVVIGADTVVVLDEEPLGKPVSAEDARAMLRRLAGREHRVVTGIALIDRATGIEIGDAVSTRVAMREASDAEIAAYVASGEPADKAGAYGIQGLGAGLVTGIVGCYFNVVGLPINRIVEHLHRILESRRSTG